MSKDFRASQVEASKLIASGGIAGTTVGLAVYSGSIASNREGGVTDSAIFNKVGSDVFFFVSGSITQETSTGAENREQVTLFGGDVVISGTLWAERQVIEVDSAVPGNFYVTGNVYFQPDSDSTAAVVIKNAAGTSTIFNVDSTNSQVEMTGRVGINDTSPDAILDVVGGASAGVGTLKIEHGEDTTNAIYVTADALTTGKGLFVNSDSNSTGTRDLVLFQNDNTAAVNTTVLHVKNDAIAATKTVIIESTAAEINPLLELKNSNAATDKPPTLSFNRSDTSAEADDMSLGKIEFRGADSGNNDTTYVTIEALASDITDGVEGGQLRIKAMSEGSDGSANNWLLMTLGGEDVNAGKVAEVVINEQGKNIDFRVESDGEDEAIFLDASAETLYINKGETAFTTIIGNTNDVAIIVDETGVVINEDGHATNDFRVESDNKSHAIFVDAGTDQVLILSGGAGTSTNESAYPDTNFFVSGSIGAKGTTIKGTAVFGGDTLVSGSLHVNNIVATILDIDAETLTIDTTSTFSIDGVGTSNITTNGVLTVSGSTGLNLHSDSGEIDITSVKANIDMNAGTTLDIDAAGAITVDSSTSTIGIGTDAVAQAINIGTGAAARTITIGNDASTKVDINGIAIELDAGANDITLNTDGGNIILADASVVFAKVSNVSSDLVISASVSDKDIIFKGSTAGASNEVMRVDSSAKSLQVDGAGGFVLKDISAPGTPASGYGVIYVNGDTPYFKTDGGTATSMIAAGGGTLDQAYDEGGAGIGAIITVDNQPVQIKVAGASNTAFAVTGSVIIGSGSNGMLPPLPGNDTNFFVSGSHMSKGTAVSGTSVFGGDLVASGTFHTVRIASLEGSSGYIDLMPTTIELGATNDVLIQSNSSPGNDTNFFVSGSIGSRGTAVRGTSVFGGDVVVSGSLVSKRTLKRHAMGWTSNIAGVTPVFPGAESDGGGGSTSNPDVENFFVVLGSGSLKAMDVWASTTANSTLGISFFVNDDVVPSFHCSGSMINNTILPGMNRGHIFVDFTQTQYISGTNSFNPGDLISIGLAKLGGDTPGKPQATLYYEIDETKLESNQSGGGLE